MNKSTGEHAMDTILFAATVLCIMFLWNWLVPQILKLI